MAGSRWTRVAAIAALVVVALGASLVGAAVAGEDEPVFHACERNGRVIPGTIRVDELPRCRWRRTLVSWNAAGRPGPQGPRGEQGPSGDPGATVADVVFRERSHVVTIDPGYQGPTTTIPATCGIGEAVIGGGLVSWSPSLHDPDVHTVKSGPFFDGTGSGWSVAWVNVGDEPITVEAKVVAICVAGEIRVEDG